MKITVAQAEERVNEIRAAAGDDETAHSREDELRRDVLETIAGSPELTPEEAQRLASIALSTQAIDFERWCA